LAHSSYGWEAGAQWADFNVGDLAAVLKQATVPSSHQRDQKLNIYSSEVVGQQMADLIIEAAAARPEAQAYLRSKRKS